MVTQLQSVPLSSLPQPPRKRDSEEVSLDELEKSEDGPIDDPGDAQRSSKSEPDGDGEEES